MEKDLNMKICFYSQASDHLLIEKIISEERFRSLFKWDELLLIADNRTFATELENLSKNVLYLSDTKIDNSSKYVPSNNYQIAMKRYTLINYNSNKQERVFQSIFSVINFFFKKNNIDSIFFAQEIQSMEGVMILQGAKRNRVKIFSPHTTRLYKKSFFNDSENEDFYFCSKDLDDDTVKKDATDLLQNFIKTKKLPYPPINNNNLLKKPILRRLYTRIYRIIVNKERVEFPDILFSIKEKFRFLDFGNLFLRNLTYNRIPKVNSIDDLPKKFIFFPLQIFPEASLNLRSPFFKDQLRLIDLIRFSMPEDYKLIIKEHPVIFNLRVQSSRNSRFYNQISKLSGVRFSSMDLNTYELIQKSSLTISISGTAVFEAYLLGKPSFTIADTSFSWMTNSHHINFNNFSETIQNYLSHEVKRDQILKSLYLYLKNIKNFTPLTSEHNPEFSFSEKNISEYIDGISQFNDSFYKKNNFTK
mgnify:CR=1 FL=1